MDHDNLSNLYRQAILEAGEDPHNFGDLLRPTVSTELHNPTCGDVIILQLKISDHIIKDIKFKGQGCIISQASASIMTDLIKGKSLDQAKKLRIAFSQMITDDHFIDNDKLKDALIFKGVRKFPQRIKCATLVWNALEKSIQHVEETNG